MLVERLTFRARYGQGDALVALFKEMSATFKEQLGGGAMRIYTDATGPMFTISFESEFADWAAYAKFMASDQEQYSDPAFQDWFSRMMACTESGERQILHMETV